MRTALAALLVSALMLAFPAAGLQEGMYMSIPNETIKCFDITLPDDAGAILKGEAEYRLQMDPAPYDTWSDLSDQIVRTDENNTVVIPVCFRSYGREIGTCAKPFTLSISSDRTPTRTVSGGVCVSTYQDMDTGPALEEGEATSSGINDNNDVLSMAFKKPIKYALPGGQATFTLQVQSHASLTVELTADSNATVSPVRSSLATSSAAPKRTLALTVTAPEEEGEYGIDVTGRIRKCTGSHCTKHASATLAVQDTIPEEGGFTVSIFPSNYNVKDLEEVPFELAITNNGPTDSFSITADFPEGIETDFEPSTVTVNGGEEGLMLYLVTPRKVSALYELEFTVERGGIKKPVTAYLSTNELLTDAMREADEVKALGDGAIGQEVDESLEGFFERYQSREYGDELETYGDLKASLDSAREKAAQEPANGGIQPTQPGPGTQPPGGMDLTLIIIIVVVAGGAIAAFLLLRKRGGKEEADIPELERF